MPHATDVAKAAAATAPTPKRRSEIALETSDPVDAGDCHERDDDRRVVELDAPEEVEVGEDVGEELGDRRNEEQGGEQRREGERGEQITGVAEGVVVVEPVEHHAGVGERRLDQVGG